MFFLKGMIYINDINAKLMHTCSLFILIELNFQIRVCISKVFFSKLTCKMTDNTVFKNILAHLSRRPKWVLISIQNVSAVCCRRVVVVNFSHFHLLLHNNMANFNQTWYNALLCERDSSLFKWRSWDALYKGEIT